MWEMSIPELRRFGGEIIHNVRKMYGMFNHVFLYSRPLTGLNMHVS